MESGSECLGHDYREDDPSDLQCSEQQWVPSGNFTVRYGK